MKFYVTFRPSGVNNLGYEDQYVDKKLKDSYAIIYAKDGEESCSIAGNIYPRWRVIYTHGYITDFDKDNFSDGCIGCVGQKSPEDEANDIIENIYEQRRNNREIENARYNNGELLSED